MGQISLDVNWEWATGRDVTKRRSTCDKFLWFEPSLKKTKKKTESAFLFNNFCLELETEKTYRNQKRLRSNKPGARLSFSGNWETQVDQKNNASTWGSQLEAERSKGFCGVHFGGGFW